MSIDFDNVQLIDIIEQIESNGNLNAIGDMGKAYGCMQIHQGTLDDFNRWNNTNYKLLDLMGEKGRQISRLIFDEYMSHYATEARIGRAVTDVDRARIWNGGPNGFKKSATRGYAYKYEKIFAESEKLPAPPVAMGAISRSQKRRVAIQKKKPIKKKKI